MRKMMTYLRRLAVVGAVMSLLVVMGAPAGAQNLTAEDTGDYSGAGRAAIVDLDVVQQELIGDLLGDSLVDLVLAPTRQAADTQNNLPTPVSGGGGDQQILGDGLNLLEGISGQNTAFGEGTNIESELAGETLLSDILVEAIATAPPTETAQDDLLNLDNSLLQATVAEAEALAVDVATEPCTETVAQGYSNLANAQVLPGTEGPLGGLLGGTGTGGLIGNLTEPLLGDLGLGGLLPTDGTIEDLDLTNGGTVPTGNLLGVGDTVSSQTATQLIEVDGQDTLGVQSGAQADLTTLSLLGGAVTAEVASPIQLQATATGNPGGASVSFSGELLNLGGTDAGNLLGAGGLLEGTNLGDILSGLGITELALNIEQPGIIAQETAADGTHAAAVASILRVQLLATGALTQPLGDLPAGTELTDASLLSVDVAPLAVVANAPPGGVDCQVPAEPAEPEPEKRKRQLPITGGGALAVAGMSILLAGSVLHRRRRNS